MNYRELVLKGYSNPITRNHLKDYFFREAGKAEQHRYPANEFFSGCLEAVNDMRHQVKQQYNAEALAFDQDIALLKDRQLEAAADAPILDNYRVPGTGLSLRDLNHITEAIRAAELMAGSPPRTEAEEQQQPPQPTDGKLEESRVREILQPFFINSADYNFDKLIAYITSEKRPDYTPVLRHEGTKKDLYKALSKLIKGGYKRKHLARVVSELCDLDEEALYKKI